MHQANPDGQKNPEVTRRDLSKLVRAGLAGAAALALTPSVAHAAELPMESVDTIGALRNAQIFTPTQTAEVLGYYAPGDGGGGVFYWDPSATDPDNGGTVIQSNRSLTGRWRRVVDDWLSVKWFGAKGDGVTDDTAAVRAAMNAVYTNAFQPPGSVYLGSSEIVEFPPGHYKINDEISINAYANVASGSKAIIEQTNPTKRIFVFSNGYTIHVSGLRFIGGTTHIHIENNNVDSSIFQIDHCEFQLSRDFAIRAIPTPPADHLSAVLTIDNCKFMFPAQVLQTYCDIACVNNSWVSVRRRISPLDTGSRPDTAMFDNRGEGLHFFNMVGVPAMNGGSDGNRWIDNRGYVGISGSVFIYDTRFGGEEAGMPIIYNYAGPQRAFPWVKGSNIVIRNSTVFAGTLLTNPESSVINLRTEVPEVLIYEGNHGPVDVPLILNRGILNLDSYLNQIPPYALQFFRIVIEPNLSAARPAQPNQTSIPPELQPFVNFKEADKLTDSPPTSGRWEAGQRLGKKSPAAFGPAGYLNYASGAPGSWAEYGKTSPFPIGTQQATSIIPGAPPRAKYTYTIPSKIKGFVAIVTFSANPNFEGSASYRTTASYLISLTTGYDGISVVDVLSSMPLFTPAATPYPPSPSLSSLHFGSDDTGSPNRPTTSGGNFTVIWTWASRLEEAYISLEVLHAFY